ncbi:MAG: hypothetical protein BGO55_07000 [Sphingobacteriales bacterium 50-39]|nr:DUF4382 domain-containing protein [Sphingobacteriales bacterium]OJW52998.1 MAG: hypothetical protein BGO55_07000 [Sphingobacteriales bacterium 50-39]
MKTVIKGLAFGIVAAGLFFIFSCNKNNSGSNPNIPPGKSQVSIYMMDDPIQYTKVLIDIRQVAVLVDTGAKQVDSDHDDQWDDDYCGEHRTRENSSVIWDTLNITPGVYDLLKLRNGTDTLLANGLIPSGKILKVRITLGSDNTVYTDSATHYPLEVFGSHPYFTINVRKVDVSAASSNDFKLWLDFNLQRSIFFWNGEFLLKPYIVVFNDHVQARIKGQALPERKVALVTAYDSNKDTLYAIPGEDGYYQMRNAPAGTYSINFKGRDGYKDTTIANISVTTGQTTKVPTVTLHQ